MGQLRDGLLIGVLLFSVVCLVCVYCVGGVGQYFHLLGWLTPLASAIFLCPCCTSWHLSDSQTASTVPCNGCTGALRRDWYGRLRLWGLNNQHDKWQAKCIKMLLIHCAQSLIVHVTLISWRPRQGRRGRKESIPLFVKNNNNYALSGFIFSFRQLYPYWLTAGLNTSSSGHLFSQTQTRCYSLNVMEGFRERTREIEVPAAIRYYTCFSACHTFRRYPGHFEEVMRQPLLWAGPNHLDTVITMVVVVVVAVRLWCVRLRVCLVYAANNLTRPETQRNSLRLPPLCYRLIQLMSDSSI